MQEYSMDEIVSLAKRRGFVYSGSEIYGGLANTWDYGPLGVELKNNIKQFWWKNFVTKRHDVVGVDSAVLMNASVWKASGHIDQFSDPLIDCRSCKARHRADKLLEEYYQKHNNKTDSASNLDPDEVLSLNQDQVEQRLKELGVPCSACGSKEFTPLRHFNLMFKTSQGVVEDSSATIYLRPETAQGIFVNFKHVQTTSRQKVPFGIAQIGKSFRNEITPGNFIFRTREFEQMELEFFCHPTESSQQMEYWIKYCDDWLKQTGLRDDLVRWREHGPEERSHYSSRTLDVEFKFPFGWGELWGVAMRGDFDLNQHQNHSKKDLRYTDPHTNEKYIPHVIEPSLGVDRLLLALLCSAYRIENIGDEQRTVLALSPKLAPIEVAILPLSKKLAENAQKLLEALAPHFRCDFDGGGSIGRRYRRQDEVGTPFCITYDFETLEDEKITVRHRDSMQQERISMNGLVDWLHAAMA